MAAYRAQRVILATGTRGKPRTLQVPGENLPKVANLLDDPDDCRGRDVLVVGGGDSAVEAALALADAGARVIISYRGKSFNRAAPKNKQAIESYAAQQRLKAKYSSQVIAFEPESVIIALADGSQKRYANHGAFVLIGADPPVTWLEKMGVRFVAAAAPVRARQERRLRAPPGRRRRRVSAGRGAGRAADHRPGPGAAVERARARAVGGVAARRAGQRAQEVDQGGHRPVRQRAQEDRPADAAVGVRQAPAHPRRRRPPRLS